MVFHLVEDGESGTQAGSALHGVLAAIAFEVFGEAVNGFEVKASVSTDSAGFFSPAHDEEFQPAGFDDVVLMVGPLFEL